MAPSDRARRADRRASGDGRPRRGRWRSPRKPAGTRSPRTGRSCSGSAAASRIRDGGPARRDGARTPLPARVRLGRAWSSCTSPTGGAASRRACRAGDRGAQRPRARARARRDTGRARRCTSAWVSGRSSALMRWRGPGGGGGGSRAAARSTEVQSVAELDAAAFGDRPVRFPRRSSPAPGRAVAARSSGRLSPGAPGPYRDLHRPRRGGRDRDGAPLLESALAAVSGAGR